jgi:hypothetical protein
MSESPEHFLYKLMGRRELYILPDSEQPGSALKLPVILLAAKGHALLQY